MNSNDTRKCEIPAFHAHIKHTTASENWKEVTPNETFNQLLVLASVKSFWHLCHICCQISENAVKVIPAQDMDFSQTCVFKAVCC